MATRKVEYRTEKDALGEMPVPALAYWGIRTARALEFERRQALHPKFLRAIVQVKKAAVEANLQIGRIDARVGRAVSLSTDEILGGQWLDQFPVPLFHPGSLLSVCANVNEVLANRAAEMLGGEPGSYEIVHPTHHVSAGQTAYDTFPTALRLTLLDYKSELEACLLDLERLLRRKAFELDKVVKPGRVHLQDSLPISLGQVFNAWGSSIGRSHRRLVELTAVLAEINPGSNELGTGFGTVRDFSTLVVEKLSELCGSKLRLSDDPIRYTQSMSDYVALSSVLKEIAIELMKISADLRLMSSGPGAGFSEVTLPAVCLEKSPFPSVDRTVPIVPEFTSMLCMQILGNDLAIMAAARDGQLECNAMLPLIAHNLISSFDALIDGINLLARKSISGLSANLDRCRAELDAVGIESLMLAKAFGEEAANNICAEAAARAVSVRDIVVERGLMTAEQFERNMDVRVFLTPQVARS
jgi:aspartate ammonia-lyase